MIIYTVISLDSPECNFATLDEAVKAARAALASPEYAYLDALEIERNETVELTKAAIIEILNTSGGGWSASSEVVKTIRRKGARA